MSIVNTQWPWRDGLSVLSYDGYLIMLAGWNPGEFSPNPSTNEIWVSANSGVTWTLLGTAPWGPRHSFGAIIKNDILYVIGSDLNAPAKDVWTYDLSQGVLNLAVALNWTEETSDWGSVGGDRILQCYFIYNDKIRMAGGQEDLNGVTMFTDVVELNESTWQFSSVGTLPISYASTCVTVNVGNDVYLYAGGQYKNGGHENPNYNMYKTTDGGSNWTLQCVLPAEFLGFMYANGAYFLNKIWLLSGDGGVANPGNQEGIWYYDFSQWSKMPQSPLARHASAMTVLDDEMFIITGNGVNDVLTVKSVNI